MNSWRRHTDRVYLYSCSYPAILLYFWQGLQRRIIDLQAAGLVFMYLMAFVEVEAITLLG